MPHTILVVDDDPAALEGMVELLKAQGYAVQGVEAFEEARRLLGLGAPDLLIADVRLGAFNGLHLVLRGRMDRPNMAALIMTGFSDQVLEAEARRHGAGYLVKPLDPPRFLGMVAELLAAVPAGPEDRRRFPRKHVTGGFPAEVASVPATVLDMSYGGLRFELAPAATDPPQSFEVSLPAFGLSLKAESVWTSRAAPSGALRCGAALSETDAQAIRAWRGVVDALAT
jgi:two-component system response regulator RegA